MEYVVQLFGWGSPLGLGLFMALLGVFLFLFSKFIQTLSSVEQEQNKKK